MFNIINFKSKPKNNPFAPEWNNFMIETTLNTIDTKKLSSFFLKKEKEILKLKINNDGYTGLKKNTTSRHNKYNTFNFKDMGINKLKKEIIKLHNYLLNRLNLNPVKSLYINSWVNILKKNEHIKPHAHSWNPDTYLGGHFCVSCKNTSTYYINPINQLCDPETYRSKNIPGKLTLFQNFIPHYTDKHRDNARRITIAFDMYLTRRHKGDIKII